MLSCGCKTACVCIRNCQCKNAGLKWINMCSGCCGRTCNDSDLNDDVVWAQPLPVSHARMYQLCGTLTVSPNLISISSPSLLYHGVVFTITHKHYCVYMLKCYDRESSHGRDLKRWIRVWDSEQLIWSIETCTFHLNASCYHLIDEVTLNDTRHGHRVFLTKLTD